MKIFSRFRRKSSESKKVLQDKDNSLEKKNILSSLKQALQKTSIQIGKITNFLLSKNKIDEQLIENIEMHLLSSDIGIESTREIIKNLRTNLNSNKIATMKEIIDEIKIQLKNILIPSSKPLILNDNKKPYVILMIGINGAGKTTTIGKLTKIFKDEYKSVLLAAGDTFRVAAIEQLQRWAEINDVELISQKRGADSASVIYDALQSAKKRNIDVLIADTAGRLHNKNNLMKELSKTVSVIKKLDKDAPHEIMLIIDSSIGQNALIQVQEFNKIVPITGITLTKMDGTSKGGIIFSIVKQFKIPIRYIGTGEKIDDLKTFNYNDFVNVIFKPKK